MNNIEIEFEDRGIIRGGLLLLSAKMAMELVSRYREEGIVIIGIDGFLVNDQVTQPDMSDSVDFTNNTGDTWERSEVFLKSRLQNEKLYEIIV